MKDTKVIGIRKKIFPRPVFSVVLLVTWLLANSSIALGTVIGGVVVALLIPALTYHFWPEAPRVRRWRPLLMFWIIVSFDIIAANLTVARLILGPTSKLRPTFLQVPVSLENPFAISIFAATISLTPGTVSSNLSGDRRTLLVHSLDTDDANTQIRLMKARYEAPLKEIFEC